MTVADDLIAVRTLLILRDRAVGCLMDDDGGVCLRKAMLMVSGEPKMNRRSEWLEDVYARDREMHRVLVRYLPQELKAVSEELAYRIDGNDSILAYFNDLKTTSDQDVLDLIDKALADMGETC